MSQKIVFFDLDGTILTKQKTISRSTKRAIALLQKQGHVTVIATGRIPYMFESIRKELNIDSYVCMNGQYVVYRGEVIYSNPMNVPELHRLTKEVSHHGHAIGYCNHHGIKTNTEEHEYISKSFQSLNMAPPPAAQQVYYTEDVFQGHLYCFIDDLSYYQQAFPAFQFVPWNDHAADILPQGASKKIGIQKVIEASGIDHQHSYAFGDGLNDIEMLEYVHTSIAMGNASPEVKKHANIITAGNEENGVWKGLFTSNLISYDCKSKNCQQSCNKSCTF